MKIVIPNSAFLGNIESFIRKIDTHNLGVLDIYFNKKWTSVHPVVLSMVAALVISMKNRGARIRVHEALAKSTPYLVRMGLFDMLGVPRPVLAEGEPAGRFIPLRVIRTSSELSDVMAELTPLLHLTPFASDTIKYVVSELVRNVFEHSGLQREAVVCAQFFEKTQRFALGIADAGIGIKSSLDTFHKPPNHLRAIQLALQPGITGTTPYFGGTANNAGAGLFVIKCFAKFSRAFFMIYSGNAMFKLLKTPPRRPIRLYADPLLDRATVANNLPYWKGTAVGFDISTESNKDFAALLRIVSDAYRLEIKQRKKQKYKKIKFT